MTPTREAGFTLLELLVSVVVLGFILVGLSQGLRYGLRASATQARLVDSRGELDAVDRTLRRLLTQAEPSAAEGPPLQGGPGTMLFRSALPQASTGFVQSEAEIGLGLDGQGRFQLRWTPYLHARRLGPAPAPTREELLRGVDRVEFAYWREGWQTSWNRPDLPALVRIRLVFAANDNRHWPDIVVAPLRKRSD